VPPKRGSKENDTSAAEFRRRRTFSSRAGPVRAAGRIEAVRVHYHVAGSTQRVTFRMLMTITVTIDGALTQMAVFELGTAKGFR
jgi:hypothetical protein